MTGATRPRPTGTGPTPSVVLLTVILRRHLMGQLAMRHGVHDRDSAVNAMTGGLEALVNVATAQ
jgi:hypothetical protein